MGKARNEKKKIADEKVADLKKSGRSKKTKKQKRKEIAAIDDVVVEKDDPSLAFEFPVPGDMSDLKTAIIKFDEASFKYEGGKETIFEGLDFGLYIDSRIGLVG